MTVALSVEELSFYYPRTDSPALKKISFSLKAGGFLGLVGPNGAGKTTLMSLISGLTSPTEGKTVFFDGAKPFQDPRYFVSIAPQEIALYLTLTAYENLAFFADIGQVPKSEKKQRIQNCLAFAGLTDQRDVLVERFSGGMKRRLNLAVALVTKPKILQLDEPTVGVDPQSRHLILSALRTLNKEGTTILFSTHYLEEVEKLCPELLVLDHGQVVFSGPTAKFKNLRTDISLEAVFMEMTGHALRDPEVTR